jgi:hypothetical protein
MGAGSPRPVTGNVKASTLAGRRRRDVLGG